MNLTSPKQIKLAKFAGFCYGVQRAVDLSIKIRKENPDTQIYILGELIHNTQVVESLQKMGIKTIHKIPEKLEGICIIRTHGTTPQVIEELKTKGCKIIDATCPDVKRAQNKATELANNDYQVVIIGKANHPEVIAIKAHADLHSDKDTLVISSKKNALEYIQEIKNAKKIGIVVQTTQYIENFQEILSFIAEHAKEIKIHNTICPATAKRQQSAKVLAQEVELMIVIGSKSSANTTHLKEILEPIKQTLHIEDSNELEPYKDLLIKTNTIGITAGASTPNSIITNVIKTIGDLD